MYGFYEDSNWAITYITGFDHSLKEYAKFSVVSKSDNCEYFGTHYSSECAVSSLFSNLHDALQTISQGKITIHLEESVSVCVEFDVVVCGVTLSKQICVVAKRAIASHISKMSSYTFSITDNVSDDWNWDAANALFLTVNLAKYDISHCLHMPCTCSLFDRHPWLLFAYITFTYGIFVNKIRMRLSESRKYFKVLGVSMNGKKFENVESVFHMYVILGEASALTSRVWFGNNRRSAKYIANFE